MNPNQPQQNNVPSIKQPGNWTPWDNFSNDVPPPPKKSFFAQYKKLIIIFSISVVILVGLAIFGAASSEQQNSEYIEGSTTTVPQKDYSNEIFTMKYAVSLNTITDQKDEEGEGWFLRLSEDVENPTYDVSFYVTSINPLYESYEEGLADQLEDGLLAENVTTSDVVMAGVQTKKAIGDYKKDGKEYSLAFSYTEAEGKYVIASANYQKDNKDIADSFDAMIGSIKVNPKQ